MANVGLGACSKNSEGGTAFETSCDGNGGQPEYWCADFAQWVWQEAGANTDGLDAAASTFYIYGQTYGTLHTKPSIGDAVVFNYMDDYAEHVALVVAIDSDGSIETVSGDWNGTGSTEAAFSSTSQVVLNVPAYPGVTGSAPDTMGMTLSAFVSPVPKGSGGTASGAPQCIAGSGQQGTCIDTSTCASTGGTSTAGYCPGPDSEECCTGT
jgi:CHAP domain